MMNDLLPTFEETATPDILAEVEHREWLRDEERREERREAEIVEFTALAGKAFREEQRWADLESQHGPLFTPREWNDHQTDLNYYLDHREEFDSRVVSS